MTEATESRVPPYISFRTLLTQIERMEKETVPTEIDKHFLVGMAGGTQNHFRHALRSLGLIQDSNRSTDLLRDLAAAGPDKRKAMFGEILRDKFPELVELPTDAAKSEYERVLDSYGAAATDTKRKALGFYVAAADYAGIPVSNFVKSRRAPSGPRRATTRRAKNTGNGKGDVDQQDTTRSSTGVLSEDEMKSAYFKLLLKKAETDNVADDMYERIERLLSVPEKKQDRGRKTAGSKPATPTDPASQVQE
jgi:hypothetical protein